MRAAVRLVALRAPDGAAEMLLALLPAADEKLGEEVLAALTALAERPAGPPAALVRALEGEPAQRAAAQAVLGKDGGVYRNRPERRLLLSGLRLPYRWTTGRDGNTDWNLTVTDWRIVNRFDDKEFVKP
jgi:hypothetical protein